MVVIRPEFSGLGHGYPPMHEASARQANVAPAFVYRDYGGQACELGIRLLVYQKGDEISVKFL